MILPSPVAIRPEFASHNLNPGGAAKVQFVREQLSNVLEAIERMTGVDGRYVALMRTKMEEAGFAAVKAIATRPENQL